MTISSAGDDVHLFGGEAFPDEQQPSLQAHPAAALFPPMPTSEFNALVRDIKRDGLQQPIVLDGEGRVLDGLNRLRACTAAGVDPAYETYTGDDPLGEVIGRNVIRRHLSVSQRAAIAVDLEDLYAADAADRQRAGKAHVDDLGASSPGGRALDFTCDRMGISRRTAQDAKYIRNHDPELFHQVWLGNMPVNAARARIRPSGDKTPLLGKWTREPHVSTWNNLSPPYGTIVCDPPWEYAKTNPDKSGEGYKGRLGLDYSSLTVDEIKALPVSDIAAVDCRLFLWVTNRYLRHAWDIVEAWGFAPMDRTLVWCKLPRATTPVTTEFILIAKRGKPPRMPWNGTTWYQWAHQNAHSAKPAAMMDLVELWCPGPYVELFSRQPRLGWDSWGCGYEGAGARLRQPEGPPSEDGLMSA